MAYNIKWQKWYNWRQKFLKFLNELHEYWGMLFRTEYKLHLHLTLYSTLKNTGIFLLHVQIQTFDWLINLYYFLLHHDYRQHYLATRLYLTTQRKWFPWKRPKIVYNILLKDICWSYFLWFCSIFQTVLNLLIFKGSMFFAN